MNYFMCKFLLFIIMFYTFALSFNGIETISTICRF
nr:MAG TPA: hypothetical protein [Caudoviricetes sp.]